MWSSTRDMVQDYLVSNFMEGLCFQGTCCCKVGNLMNCVGKKERFCAVDSCEPCADISKAAQEIMEEQNLQLHTTEQRNAIIAMAKNKEPEFVW